MSLDVRIGPDVSKAITTGAFAGQWPSSSKGIGIWTQTLDFFAFSAESPV
jgi:hypothetical protein